MEEFKRDLERLLIILKKFSLNAIKSGANGHGDSISRLIFCQILSSKYDMILPKGKHHEDMKEDIKYKRELQEFLNIANYNTITYYFRDGALNSLIGYGSYELKYKVCKLAFEEDPLYLELEKLERVRDEAQEKMNELMAQI